MLINKDHHDLGGCAVVAVDDKRAAPLQFLLNSLPYAEVHYAVLNGRERFVDARPFPSPGEKLLVIELLLRPCTLRGLRL